MDPDEHKPSECFPKQVYTEDMSIRAEYAGDRLIITVNSESYKDRMVTGVFDVPYEADFTVTFDKADVTAKKITDGYTGNTHLFIDLGEIPAGKTVITAQLSGKVRTVQNAELIRDGFALIYFGDHAYMRSMDKEMGIQVSMSAPQGAYLRLISGKKIFAQQGVLKFTVNTCWEDEAPILYGFPQECMHDAILNAKVQMLGQTTCSRWSGQ